MLWKILFFLVLFWASISFFLLTLPCNLYPFVLGADKFNIVSKLMFSAIVSNMFLFSYTLSKRGLSFVALSLYLLVSLYFLLWDVFIWNIFVGCLSLWCLAFSLGYLFWTLSFLKSFTQNWLFISLFFDFVFLDYLLVLLNLNYNCFFVDVALVGVEDETWGEFTLLSAYFGGIIENFPSKLSITGRLFWALELFLTGGLFIFNIAFSTEFG